MVMIKSKNQFYVTTKVFPQLNQAPVFHRELGRVVSTAFTPSLHVSVAVTEMLTAVWESLIVQDNPPILPGVFLSWKYVFQSKYGRRFYSAFPSLICSVPPVSAVSGDI